VIPLETENDLMSSRSNYSARFLRRLARGSVYGGVVPAVNSMYRQRPWIARLRYVESTIISRLA
jgi:hypothetical protein